MESYKYLQRVITKLKKLPIDTIIFCGHEYTYQNSKFCELHDKNNQNLKILGGIMGNDVLDVAGVQAVATLPTLDEARAKIVGILSSPAQKIVSILLAPASKIAILALEKSKK